ncbi:aldose 1-epimerase family protein [Dysosmobacter sp.]
MKKEALCEKLGNIEQLAGIREVRDTVTNMRLIDVWNGRLRFTVLVDRGFDIGPLSLDGRNQVFQARGGLAHRTRNDILGGLFFTCGPDNAGPAEDGLRMHGSFRTTPAVHVSTQAHWVQDRYHLALCAEVRHASLFGGSIVLRRTIETDYDCPALSVKDCIINEGYAPWPLMLLYHINVGYPLLQPGTQLTLPPCKTRLRENQQAAEPCQWNRMPSPRAGALEQVYYHEGIAGPARLLVQNTESRHGLTICYDADALPVLTQWVSPAAGDYALGLEPGTCHVEGLSGERRLGSLEMLDAGACKQVQLSFSFF